MSPASDCGAARLQGCAVTLVQWGEDDQFQPIHYGERLARDIPRARLVRIPRARHFVMFDQPRAVISRLAEFLAAA